MKIVVLDDGNRGNFNPALGIAEQLPAPEIETIKIPPLSFFQRLILIQSANFSPFLPISVLRFLLTHLACIKPYFCFPIPSVIISAGAKLAPINILMSRSLGSKSIHFIYPYFTRARLFDLLVVPELDLWRHRKAPAENMIVIKGAPNRIHPSSLINMSLPRIVSGNQAPADSNCRDSIYGTRIAVLIGGDTKNYRISEEWAEKLSRRLTEISEKFPAKIYLTTSRRTSAGVEGVFQKLLGNDPEKFHLVLYRQTFANPVSEFLAAADLVITTEDSNNMVSESASSGKPTAVLRVERKRKKRLVFDRALENLDQDGYIKLITIEDLDDKKIGELVQSPPRKVLAETEKVSRKVLALLKAEKILIVSVRYLGDNLISSPAYRTIRENFPLAKIDVITDLRSAGYFGKHPYFREVFYYDKKADRYEKSRFLREIQREKYDCVFDFRNSAFGVTSNARRRATFYRQTLFGVRKGEHETDRWLRMLAYFLPISPDRSFRFPLSEEDFAWVEETIAGLKLKGRDFVVLNPGGRWDKKRWPPENFAKLADLIWRNYHLPSVVVGDKNETELADKVVDNFLSPQGRGEVRGQIINLAGQTTVRQLTALLSKAALLVSNDTGTVHLASAVHCPVAVLFGPGDWYRYGPYQTEYQIISSGLTCSPCLKVTCPKNFVCWRFITPDKVLAEIAPLIQTPAIRPKTLLSSYLKTEP